VIALHSGPDLGLYNSVDAADLVADFPGYFEENVSFLLDDFRTSFCLVLPNHYKYLLLVILMHSGYLKWKNIYIENVARVIAVKSLPNL
jgi:hypothetical protein